MNRRRLIISASAASAMLALPAAAQRTTRGTTQVTSVESELTGAIIDFAESGLTLSDQNVDPDGGGESIVLNDDHTELTLFFFPAGAITAEQLFDLYVQDAVEAAEQIEERGSEIYDDGGWAAAAGVLDGVAKGSYLEFQLDAFPDYDVGVELFADAETMAESFEEAQAIDFEGGPPFLFLEENEADLLDYVLVVAGTTGRTTRRGGGQQTDPTPTSSGRSGRTTPSGNDADAFLQTLRKERDNVRASVDEFLRLLGETNKPNISDTEFARTRDALILIGQGWMNYPSVARTVTIPAGSEELGDLYLEWADALGAAGTAFIGLLNGMGSEEAFQEAADAFDLIDLIFATAIGQQLRSSPGSHMANARTSQMLGV